MLPKSNITFHKTTKWFKLSSVLVICSTILIFNSCREGVLETPTFGETTSANFWRNATDAEAAVNAIYAPLPEENFYGHIEQTLTNVPSDDEFRAGDHANHIDIENFTIDARHPYLNTSWENKYEMINRANLVIINVTNIDMDQGLKNRILGEAYYLRGFSYWILAKLFGGVPLILEQEIENNEFNIPRATLEATYSQIESDLLRATELLPENYSGSNVGRAHSGAAWGLLTKLYVYQEKFQEAINSGTNVINGPYPLATSFEDNFKIETQYNPEILFTIGSTQGWQEQVHSIYTTPRPWGGWDFQAPLPNLINEFESDDPRLDYSIMMPGDTFDLGGDRGLSEYTADLSPTTGFHFQKFAAWRDAGGLDLDVNIPILRASDVYLLVAEAKIRSGGNGNTELNKVRERAGLNPITGRSADMGDIIHERRVELAGEGQRHFDLMRWDKADIVDIVSIYGEDRGEFDPPRFFERPKNYFYPIPQDQIDISDGVLEQNPGFN